MTPKVLIVGAGAIGGFYGSLLAKAGANVSTVCRSDYQIVKNQGFSIESTDLGQWQFFPADVLPSADQYRQTADYVVLCTKVLPDLDRVSLIKPAVSNNTCIVFIQNGVDIEKELRAAFPDNEIISGIAFICCNKTQAGKIKHLAYGRLVLGSLSGLVNESAFRLCELFRNCGIDCSVSDDIVTERWKKCVWNASFNPISVLSGGLLTAEILSNQEDFVRSVMSEVCIIAESCGHKLPDSIIDSTIEYTYKMPPYKTSMLLDFENKKPMETEAILGNPFRLAKKAKIACPYIETLYALLKLCELSVTTH